MTANQAPFLSRIFNPAGRLSEIRADYDFRPGQLAMAETVAEAAEAGGNAIIEAGTGIGKTLAYLVPLLHNLADGDKPVIISTATKNLQQQILVKDVPIVEEILRRKIRAMVAYGAANYLCPRRFGQYRPATLDAPPVDHELWAEIEEWSENTRSGLRGEFTRHIPAAVWSGINRDSDNCLGKNCPLYEKSFYFKERKLWQTSQVLIVNHHLLAYHLLADGGVLPDFDILVVDEAHEFPDTILSANRREISVEILDKFISPMRRNAKFPPDFLRRLPRSRRDALARAVEAYKDGFDRNWSVIQNSAGLFREGDIILDQAIPVPADLTLLGKSIGDIMKPIIDEGKSDEDAGAASKEAELFFTRLARFTEAHNLLVTHAAEDHAYWLQSGGGRVVARVAPTDPGKIIGASALAAKKCVIFTSATLSVGERNDYFQQEIALPVMFSRQFPSPFDYRQNVVLYLAGHIPPPEKDDTQFIHAIAEEIPQLVRLTDGGAFILFTARRMLQTLEATLTRSLGGSYPLVSQEKSGPDAALRAFLGRENSVLLGLASFWQGVDVRGHALRHVILVRLPFVSPDDPVLRKRAELLTRAGRNTFTELQLPQAVLMFKQGFGRLIRGADDKGMITVLDPRIVSKSYGAVFTHSIPHCRTVNSLEAAAAAYRQIIGGDHV